MKDQGSQKAACAQICGGELAPNLIGRVCFFDVPGGTWVEAEICGLPPYSPAGDNGQPIGPHGFHIHAGSNCGSGSATDPFALAGSHWNPDDQPHGNHAGDFPVLFSNQGVAMMHFFTDRFLVSDVIGKTVVIHQSPDDYRTQPSGNSGKRIACGVIRLCCGCR